MVLCGIATMVGIILNGACNHNSSRFNSGYNDSADIQGIVKSLSYYQSSVLFSIEGSRTHYSLYAFGNSKTANLDARDLWRFVRIGDSIVKRSFADSVCVIRNGRRYNWSLRN